MVAILRSELRPRYRANKSSRAKSIGTQNVLDKHSERTGKLVQCIVESDDTVRRHIRGKAVEVCLCALIGMVAVDPEKADGAIPSGRNRTRKSTMGLNVIGNPGSLKVAQKLFIR